MPDSIFVDMNTMAATPCLRLDEDHAIAGLGHIGAVRLCFGKPDIQT